MDVMKTQKNGVISRSARPAAKSVDFIPKEEMGPCLNGGSGPVKADAFITEGTIIRPKGRILYSGSAEKLIWKYKTGIPLVFLYGVTNKIRKRPSERRFKVREFVESY